MLREYRAPILVYPPMAARRRRNEYEMDEVRIYRQRGAEAGVDWAEAVGDDASLITAARAASETIVVPELRRAYFRGFVDAANEVLGL